MAENPSTVATLPASRRESGETRKLTLVQAVNQAIFEMMAFDERVLAIGEDIGLNGGVFRATEGLLQAFGPERVLESPVAESGIIGMSIGLALAGFRPVAEIQFMGFVYPGINQLFAHAARIRNRTRGAHSVPLVVRMPYGGGIRAPEHHSESYEAIMVHTPGLQVVIPSTPVDAKGLLISAIKSNDPVVFLEPKRIYRAFKEDVPTGIYEVPLGKAKVLKEGRDVTLISYGAMIRPSLEAYEQMKAEGISVEVIDLRTLMPLDLEALLVSITKTGRVVVVHEGPRTCGIGAEIAALVNERLLVHLLSPVERVTGFDTVFPYAMLEHHYLPGKERIVRAIKKTIEY
jgi:pyruvate dehydrogenase E1 component beta subunit